MSNIAHMRACIQANNEHIYGKWNYALPETKNKNEKMKKMKKNQSYFINYWNFIIAEQKKKTKTFR